MSSILKALRKVEDDKASLGEGSVDLAHDILKGHYEQPKSPIGVVVSMSVAALVLVAGVFWFLFLPSSQEQVGRAEQVLTVEPQIEVPQVNEAQVRDITQDEVALELPAVKTAESLPSFAEREPNENRQTNIVSSSTVIPSLFVEEIVYHDESASRMAVINQLPVMEGTAIEDVLVEKIYPDRVQFSYQGVRFNKFRNSAD